MQRYCENARCAIQIVINIPFLPPFLMYIKGLCAQTKFVLILKLVFTFHFVRMLFRRVTQCHMPVFSVAVCYGQYSVLSSFSVHMRKASLPSSAIIISDGFCRSAGCSSSSRYMKSSSNPAPAASARLLA